MKTNKKCDNDKVFCFEALLNKEEKMKNFYISALTNKRFFYILLIHF